MLFIGIDPGKDGGVAILDSEAKMLQYCPMPLIGSGKSADYDRQRMYNLLHDYWIVSLYLEAVNVRPIGKQRDKLIWPPPRTLRPLWQCYDIWETLAWTYDIPCHIVIPKDDLKAASIRVAMRLWPSVDFRRTERCRKPHDGMTDAALIAEYGRRQQLGKRSD
jgi:hypothetical protein